MILNWNKLHDEELTTKAVLNEITLAIMIGNDSETYSSPDVMSGT